MNYDQPSRHKDGGWHFTSRNDGQIRAIGYCAEHPTHETEDDARRCYRDYELNERLRLDGTVGHWNPCEAPFDDAPECGREIPGYLGVGGHFLQPGLCRLPRGHAGNCARARLSEPCGTLTNRQASIEPWGPRWLLCDEHRTKGVCAALYGPLALDSVHS